MPDSPRLAAEISVEVPFHDVDAMQVVWHGRYLKYLELARCALLQRIEYDYPQMHASGFLWPIVECHVKYLRPARYGQRLTVRAELLEWENRLKIAYSVRDLASGERLTTGWTVQVAVDADSGELQFVSPPALLVRLDRC